MAVLSIVTASGPGPANVAEQTIVTSSRGLSVSAAGAATLGLLAAIAGGWLISAPPVLAGSNPPPRLPSGFYMDGRYPNGQGPTGHDAIQNQPGDAPGTEYNVTIPAGATHLVHYDTDSNCDPGYWEIWFLDASGAQITKFDHWDGYGCYSFPGAPNSNNWSQSFGIPSNAASVEYLNYSNTNPGGGYIYDAFDVVSGTPDQPAPAASTSYPPGLPGSANSTDPVNTLTGNFGYSHTDLTIPGRGPSPTFVRSYNSTDTRGPITGANWVSPLGPGWTNNYAVHLASPGDGTSDKLLVGPQGRTDRYTALGGGAFARSAGVTTVLVANGDGTYTAALADQTRWTFDQNGRLTSIADRYDSAGARRVSNLTYNSNGQLVTVSDPAGRGSLSFGYDPTTGLLTSATDWSGRVVKYGYDANSPPRLVSVTDRNNQVTTYTYDGTSQRLLTIKDANNHTALTMSYDSQGRVATQKDAVGLSTGQQTTFSYGIPGQNGNVSNTVTYPANGFDGFAPQQVDTYNNLGQVTQQLSKPSSTETLTSVNGHRERPTGGPRGIHWWPAKVPTPGDRMNAPPFCGIGYSG
ncbi:MAG: hypothetical protein JOZ65_32500 [Chloroflexi bacterium]|nr:hypothetical protein [Chloroflexota bacterium]